MDRCPTTRPKLTSSPLSPGFFLRKLTIIPALHAFQRTNHHHNPTILPFNSLTDRIIPKPIPFLMCLHVRPPSTTSPDGMLHYVNYYSTVVIYHTLFSTCLMAMASTKSEWIYTFMAGKSKSDGSFWRIHTSWPMVRANYKDSVLLSLKLIFCIWMNLLETIVNSSMLICVKKEITTFLSHCLPFFSLWWE